ncbi:DUF4153 domain-containing protein [Adhaeribacter swui]|uniref:DUF4153 domain-containing protein n=1 Tax=Adhaeribacter swui TaxID=2086471 RepID=A0A7G7GER0_9BACT|nr:DUF4153 domain-containing protein [Adhaeribacter swui]QNF35644.1 DUF4153 domain-containing protein [Adhaeribacter swui]
MRDDILAHLHDPAQLEQLYRNNKAAFKQQFQEIYPQLNNNVLANFWYERLRYETDEIAWGSAKELKFVVLACLLAGLLAKWPAIFAVSEEFFYPRNIGFIVFPFLAAYFVWKNKIPGNKKAFLAGVLLVCLVYINLLPHQPESDTLILACIHLPLLLWAVLGVSFAGDDFRSTQKRLDFLRFNGDLAVMCALLGIAGVIMTAITINLFLLINLPIDQFYFKYVAAFGLPAVPIVATHLTQTNPQLVNKVSPVIAKVFSPLVLVMLVIYLGAIIFSGKDPYNDREFLLLFNLLLMGVMALIFFSVAESSNKPIAPLNTGVLLLLAFVTVVVNGIALSAILFRLVEWGITPNRVAVLGANVLIMVHLLLITVMLYKNITQKVAISAVGQAIARYLPIYFIWTLIVVFIFPLLFNFK